MFTIVISEKGGAERRETFDKNEINVGRVQGNDLMLPKGNVSKHHARLLYRDGRFIVTDLKSTNGTYVNGRKISQATIVREGDKIYIGDFVLRLETEQKPAAYVEDEAGSAPAPPPRIGSVARDRAVPPPVPTQARSALAPPSVPAPVGGPAAGAASAVAHAAPSSPRLSEPGVSHYPLERDPDSESSLELRPVSAKGVSVPARAPQQTEPQAVYAPRSVPPPRVVLRETPRRAGHRLALITLVDRVADVVDLAVLKDSPVVSEEVAQSIERSVRQEAKAMREEGEAPDGFDLELLVRDALRELVGLGPVGPLLEDDETTEFHVLRPDSVFVSRNGATSLAEASFTSEEALARVVGRLAHQSGDPLRHAEEIIDRRLPRGATMTAIAPPAASGWVLHVQKRRRVEASLGELVRLGAMSEAMASFLESAVAVRANVLVVGSSPSVVALILGAIAAAAPKGELVAVLQRGTDEIAVPHAHVVHLRLSEDPARGSESVRGAGRLGLDRLIVTSVVGSIAAATIDVIAEGTEGVLAGMAAPSLRHALARLATQVALARPGSSAEAAAQAVGDSFDIAVDVQSIGVGRLRAVRLAELLGTGEKGGGVARDLFVFGTNGADEPAYVATGLAPRLSLDFAARTDGSSSRLDATARAKGGQE